MGRELVQFTDRATGLLLALDAQCWHWDGHAQLHGRAADVDALAGAVRVIGVFFGYLVLVTFAAGRQGLGALRGHADARGGPR